jgi:iron complex transport system substrate-binding protein
MNRLIRLSLAILAVAVLAACGAPATTSAPSAAPSSAPAAADESAASATTSGAAFPRTIKHVRGELTVPRAPERIVSLDWLYTEEVLALGMQPVGAPDIANYTLWVKTPTALDASVADVGLRGEPNLETIAALKPDLILALAPDNEPRYAELSAIAPTLLLNPFEPANGANQYNTMRASFLTVAQALGRDAEGEAVLAQLDQRLADMATQIEQAGFKDQPFVVAQAYSSDNAAQVRLFNQDAMATQVVEQLGLKCAWSQADQDVAVWGFSAVSAEVLPQLGQAHFFYVVQDNDNVFASAAVKPLWDSLPFVKAGRAHPIGGDAWFFGGPLSAELIAAKATQALLKASGG